MISSTSSLTNLLYENSSVKISAGCTVEYNMNNLLDNIVATYDSAMEENYSKSPDGRINVFKKLFPIDSILKPFRPIESGVKYYIMLSDDITANPYVDYRTVPYPKSEKPRMYYPGTTNFYKYWVTPENGEVDVTVRYVQESATISESYSTGPSVSGQNTPYPDRVIYTTTSPHGFTAGQSVTISGSTALNLSGTIASILSPTQFILENSIAATTATGGTATLSSPTKAALANKIVIRFEKYHKLPSTCSVAIDYASGVDPSPLTSLAIPNTGVLEIYWNGSSWSTTPPFSSSQAISWPAPKDIKSIRVYGTGAAGTGRVFGLIEISARWVKDITQDVVSFDIQKESTADENSILPVGLITANSMQMSLVKYNQTNIRVLPYNRDEAWTTNPVPNDVIYLYKNVQMSPYLIVYHSNGAVTDGALKYDRINQGTFFIDSYEISTYGDTSINALDGAKYLMETIPIDLYLEQASVTSIIMTLLDTIGFTNYNFNLSNNETSVPVMRKWWSENNKTTWEHIQELCRDIQMNAFFDENNILQFYSRDYIYNKSSVDWNFYHEQTVVDSRTRLPNIIEFSKKEIASANQVKVIWRTPISSLYEQDAEGLWVSEPTYLAAGGLVNTIESTTKAENINFMLDLSSIANGENSVQSTFNFSGYFLVGSEIFEYDAIEFEYVLEGSNSSQKAWIESKSQWASIRAASKVDPQYFKPTGRYRIKNRGVFGTTKDRHEAVSAGSTNKWELVKEDRWDV